MKGRRTYPPIPESIDAPSGRIQIVMSDDLDGKNPKPDDVDTMGQYDYLTRIISLRRKMTRRQQWFTLFHELTHLWLHESGLTNGLNHQLEEAICDAVGTGMMRERFGG
jgi:Zn-dependent peptidase ImmA (M78 family)